MAKGQLSAQLQNNLIKTGKKQSLKKSCFKLQHLLTKRYICTFESGFRCEEKGKLFITQEHTSELVHHLRLCLILRLVTWNAILKHI